MKTQVDALVSNYLERLADSLAPLPRPRRRQLLTEIAEHIDHARQGLDPDDEIGLLGVLDAVGDPETIAEEALGVAFGDRASLRTDRVERLVPWLVCFGGFVFGVGWLAGMALLWTSAAWRVRDKLLATLVVPGGLLLPVLLLGMSSGSTSCYGYGGPGIPTVNHCTTSGVVLPLPVGIAVLVVTVLGPILVAVHLSWVREFRRPTVNTTFTAAHVPGER